MTTQHLNRTLTHAPQPVYWVPGAVAEVHAGTAELAELSIAAG